MREFKRDIEPFLVELEWEYGVTGEENVKAKINKDIDDAYELIEKLDIKDIQDIFKLDPKKYSWIKIVNIILNGLCLEKFFVRGISYSVVRANERAKEVNHHCRNDDYVADDTEKFGIGNCKLHCEFMESDEDGFVCTKHSRWLSPSLPNGEWFSGQGLVLF